MPNKSFKDIYLISGSGSLSLDSRPCRVWFIACRSAMVKIPSDDGHNREMKGTKLWLATAIDKDDQDTERIK